MEMPLARSCRRASMRRDERRCWRLMWTPYRDRYVTRPYRARSCKADKWRRSNGAKRVEAESDVLADSNDDENLGYWR